AGANIIAGVDRKGVMDDLISSLKTGDMFKNKPRGRGRNAPSLQVCDLDAEALLKNVQKS
ncbi:hypothetical protein HK096_011208, partial [Nowakowskiella sp. JEL0078]